MARNKAARKKARMVNQKTYVFSTIVFLLGAGAFTVLIDPARAQNTTEQESAAVILSEGSATAEAKQSETETPDQDGMLLNPDFDPGARYEQLLRMALGDCFKEAPDIAADTVVSIGFDLDDQGQLSGIPEPLGGATASADMRRLYLHGATALDECAPYPSDGKSASFQASFSNNEIYSLARTSDPSVDQAPSLQQVAAAVHKPATQEAERALSLNRGKRREIQRRLQLLGFDPKGVDGVLGQQSRDAISFWQSDKGFPATGFLNAVQLLALNAQSQAEYAEYLAKKPKKKKTKRRVKVCQPPGLFGIQYCRYEYRSY